MQKIIWAVVAVVIIGGGFWWWQSSKAPALSDDATPVAVDTVEDASVRTSTSTTTGAVSSANTGTSAALSASVTYNGSSFSPSEVTIKKGGTVTFTSTGGSMWVASGPHPQHTAYDGTDRSTHCAAGYAGAKPFDQCAAGTTYTFTFNKVGTSPYHNHVNASAFGKITVVE